MRISFNGITIVKLGDNVTRECVRFHSNNRSYAILQKNGNVAVKGVTLERCVGGSPSVWQQAALADLLAGLGLLSPDVAKKLRTDYKAQQHAWDMERLQDEAKALGCKVVPVEA